MNRLQKTLIVDGMRQKNKLKKGGVAAFPSVYINNRACLYVCPLDYVPPIVFNYYK